jgi:tetratricopeptide (TPR) repeat protein
MKQLYQRSMLLSLLGAFMFCSQAIAQLDLPRGSQMAKVSQRIGITDVTIVYSRPSVNDREIWGALVPYGMNNLGFGTAKESPWRAGANENTVIKFSDDVSIEGQALKAGKYGLHMVVREDNTATIIFSNNHGAWGSYFYEPEEDALRVDVSMKDISHVEQLTYSFNDVDATSAVASLNWEKKQIPFKIEANVTEIVMADIRQKLQDTPGFSRQSWEQAANYALNNGGDLDQAMNWIDAAIDGQFFSQKTFNNLSIKAQILAKQGNSAAADALMQEAMPLGTVFQVHGYGRQLIGQGEHDKAMEVFKWNARNHKDQWPVNYGMARAYSAKGDHKNTVKYLKLAHDNAPAQVNKDRVAANLSKAEKGEAIN